MHIWHGVSDKKIKSIMNNISTCFFLNIYTIQCLEQIKEFMMLDIYKSYKLRVVQCSKHKEKTLIGLKLWTLIKYLVWSNTRNETKTKETKVLSIIMFKPEWYCIPNTSQWFCTRQLYNQNSSNLFEKHIPLPSWLIHIPS